MQEDLDTDRLMQYIFKPDRRLGILTLLILALVLILGVGLYFLFIYSIGYDNPATSLGVSLLITLLLSIIAYHIFEITSMSYELDRNYLMVRWGFRKEVILLSQIEWIRPAEELGLPLVLPLFRLPGVILGKKIIEGLGVVEFIGTSKSKLLIIATADRLFAISPEETSKFSSAYKRMNELGSLDSVQAQSINPRTLFKDIWSNKIVKWLIISGLILGICLIILVFFLNLSIQTIVWTDGQIVPVDRLILLVLLNSFIWFSMMIFGVVLTIRGKVKPQAIYLLWGSSVMIALLFILVVVRLAT